MDSLRGRRVAVFGYTVDQAYSALSLRLNGMAKVTIPYHGSVYADPSMGIVWPITHPATDIPRSLQTEQISTEIDFNEVAIGGATYLLPTKRCWHKPALLPALRWSAIAGSGLLP